MTACLLSPHNDDAELFACGILLQHRPKVFVILRSDRMAQPEYPGGQTVTAQEREAETDASMRLLGCTWKQWPYLDSAPAWSEIRLRVQELEARFDHCFAPAVEAGGHEQHNAVGELAVELFGPDRVTQYLTYTREGGRSAAGRLVPCDLQRKQAALACYRSQASHPMTRAHFSGPLDEYVVAA